MANTGIIQRREKKDYFYTDETKPLQGEIVYAIDTDEFGTINSNGDIEWIPRKGLVTSVAHKNGDVELDKTDVGLDQVDNTSDFDKPVSNATLKLHLEHSTDTKNPHKVNKFQVGLGNVDNTADIDKPVSNLTKQELQKLDDKKVNNSRVLTDVPENAKFTDTTYSIQDGELSEFNFNLARKDKLDNLEHSNYVLGIPALSVEGREIKLTRGDGTFETIQTQDTIYNDRYVLEQLENLKNTKLDNTIIPANAKFTDTIYDDTELRNKINDLNTEDLNIKNTINTENTKLKSEIKKVKDESLPLHGKADDAKLLNGKKVKSDYSINDDESPASITAVREVYLNSENKLAKSDIIDDLTTGGSNKALSAEQGKALNELVKNISKVLSTSSNDIQAIKDVIELVKNNKKLLENLKIDSILGLKEALNSKLNISDLTGTKVLDLLNSNAVNTNLNADKLDGKDSSEFNQVIGVDYSYTKPNVGSNEPEKYPFVTNLVSDKGVIKNVNIREYSISDIKSDFGVDRVDNTSDLEKPVSTAVQAKLNEINNKISNIGNLTNSMTYKTITNITELAGAKPGLYRISSANYSIAGQTFTDDYILKLSDTDKLHILVN